MAKQDLETTEYTWDSGTYQTGASQPNKSQSGLITGLLIATIFLGGIASALGIMNIRLLARLGQRETPVLPVAVDATGGSVSNFLRENGQSTPQVPENGRLQLKTGSASAPLTIHTLQEKAAASVAEITVLNGQGLELTGQGLILSADGYLLTNAHLACDAADITVGLPDGRVLPAAVVAIDHYSDLAVLYVSAGDLTAAVFGENGSEQEGYAVSGSQSLSGGSFLTPQQSLQVGGSTIMMRKTDLSAQSGPVFNAQGQVVGFLCRPIRGDRTGMMIPAAQVRDIAAQLVEREAVSGRPGLGLQAESVSNFCRQYWGLDWGLEVTAVTEGGAAWQQGLLPGDILLAMDGQALTTLGQLYEALLEKAPGEEVTFQVFRAGQQFTVTVPVTYTP